MNPPDTASFLAAQITIANWYLDRAAQWPRETSSRYLQYAQQAYEIVMHLVPQMSLDEISQGLHRELSVLRERLRVLESGLGDFDGGGDAPECTGG
jgi:hypothetical protein